MQSYIHFIPEEKYLTVLIVFHQMITSQNL